MPVVMPVIMTVLVVANAMIVFMGGNALWDGRPVFGWVVAFAASVIVTFALALWGIWRVRDGG